MGLRRRIFATQIATLAIASTGGVLGHVLAQHQQQRIVDTILLQQTTSLERSGDGRTAKTQPEPGANAEQPAMAQLAKPQPERQASLAGVQRTLKAELRQANRVVMVFTLLGLGLGVLLAGVLNQMNLAPLRRLENRMTQISSSTVPGGDPFEVTADAPEEVRSLATSYAALLDRIRILIARVEDLNLTDSLTLLGNRRQFQRSLESEWRRMQRQGQPLSLLMVDLDHFKAFNDNHGHLEGDRTLVRVGAAIRGEGRRSSDLSCRIGGEEFAVLLPDTDRQKARSVAQRILDAVDALDIPHRESPTAPHVTVSIGVACCEPGEGVQPEDLYAAADEALYRGKRQIGRHRVCGAAETAQLRNSLE